MREASFKVLIYSGPYWQGQESIDLTDFGGQHNFLFLLLVVSPSIFKEVEKLLYIHIQNEFL